MEHLRDIHHVPEFQRLEIQHFFEVYKAIEPGKEVRTEAWADRRAAEAEIEACRKRFAEAEEHGDAGEHGGGRPSMPRRLAAPGATARRGDGGATASEATGGRSHRIGRRLEWEARDGAG